MSVKTFQIPERLQNILIKNNNLNTWINNSVKKIISYMEKGILPFFPEYTNHGEEHFAQVMDWADKLIPENSIKDLNPNFVAVLVLGVLLHDLGMHLHPEGFYYLISGNYNPKGNKIDVLGYQKLWENFLEDAQKWSPKKIIDIFGSDKNNKVFEIPKDHNQLNKYHKMLIGEFLRIHHPRLAHDIALNGFPVNNNVEFLIKLIDDFNNDYTEIVKVAGLVARSHGVNLRDGQKWLETIRDINPYTFNHTNGVYAMAILRLADVLQVQADRIPYNFSTIHEIISPFSKIEQDGHLKTPKIDVDHRNKEGLYIETKPDSAFLFLKIKNMVNYIQNELDVSWAVISEIYQNKFGLTYRRVDSTLSDKEVCEDFSFVPDKFTLSVNNDIVSLLIAPLYGDDPKYGFRELLQNAMDACKERLYLERKNNNISYEPKITVRINQRQAGDQNEYWYTIEDNGIGMDIKTIKDYFLVAGSSFASSKEYKDVYKGTDGYSRINRVGKFGVGVLAGFLIGDEIEVETRPMEGRMGYKFKVGFNNYSPINVKRDTQYRLTGGTKVSIKINEHKTINTIIEKRNLDDLILLYIWDDQIVNDKKEIEINYWINEEKIDMKPTYANNLKFYDLSPKKKSSSVDFRWNSCYEHVNNKRKLISINGIIARAFGLFNSLDSDFLPIIIIDDKDDFVDFNLSRSKISFSTKKSIFFRNDLYKIFAIEFISILMAIDLNLYVKNDLSNILNNNGVGKFCTHFPWIFTQEGWTTGLLFDPQDLIKANESKLIYVEYKSSYQDYLKTLSKEYIIIQYLNNPYKLNIDPYSLEYLPLIFAKVRNQDSVDMIKFMGREPKRRNWKLEGDHYIYNPNNFTCPKITDSTPHKLLITNFNEKSKSLFIPQIGLFKDFQFNIDALKHEIFNYIDKNNFLIPYDLDERKDTFGDIFNEFGEIIESYRKILSGSVSKK